MRSEKLRERVAVLLGIPVTRDDFCAKAADPKWDYGRMFLSGLSAEMAFEQIYEPTCVVAADLLQRAELEWVSVYPDATLHDLVSSTRTHDVIIMVAHWRNFIVDSSDLLDDWIACLKHGTHDSVIECIINELDSRCETTCVMSDSSDASDRRDYMVKILNHLIDVGKLDRLLPNAIRDFSTHSLINKTLSRDLLDDAFNGTLRRGNQLELTDGLHTVEDVNSAIDTNFRGVVDLSCCTSSILGTFLKFMRSDMLRVIMGDHLVVPAPQLRLIERTIELLSLRPSMRYIDAKTVLVNGLAELRQGRATAF